VLEGFSIPERGREGRGEKRRRKKQTSEEVRKGKGGVDGGHAPRGRAFWAAGGREKKGEDQKEGGASRVSDQSYLCLAGERGGKKGSLKGEEKKRGQPGAVGDATSLRPRGKERERKKRGEKEKGDQPCGVEFPYHTPAWKKEEEGGGGGDSEKGKKNGEGGDIEDATSFTHLSISLGREGGGKRKRREAGGKRKRGRKKDRDQLLGYQCPPLLSTLASEKREKKERV